MNLTHLSIFYFFIIKSIFNQLNLYSNLFECLNLIKAKLVSLRAFKFHHFN